MTDPLGENSRNPAKKQEKKKLSNTIRVKTLSNTRIINNMLVLYKIWKKNNEIQLTKNKMDLNNRK